MTDICERLVRFAGKVCISTDTEVEAASIIEALRAENARLLVRLEKAQSFISRADWMQFFEEEHAAARMALGETE